METQWTRHRMRESSMTSLMDEHITDGNISYSLMNRLKARIERRVGKTRYRGPSERRYFEQSAEPPLTPAA